MQRHSYIVSGLRHILYCIALIMAGAALSGCIRNDIPYPELTASIASLDVEGAESVSIDSEARTVDIVLSEQTDIRKVNILRVVFNNSAVRPSMKLAGIRDLSQPIKLVLSTYQDYSWIIRASQTIERHFTVSGQVGAASIDETNFRAIVSVSPFSDLERLSITSLKLGPEGITEYEPDPATLHDFSDGQEITVRYHDITEVWHLYADYTDNSVQFTGLDAWTRVAWLRATGIAGRDNGFRYRKAGETEWIEVGDINDEGGSFSASIDGLEPLTGYECIAYSGGDETDVQEFTTDAEAQVPNGSFETFSNDESDKFVSFYNPLSSEPELRTKWWGSGNRGSTTVGSSYAITVPETADSHDGQFSVKLASAYVVIKFAAGNIFSGEYYKTEGTSGGIIHLGRPFTQRPRKVTVWLKYKSGIIPEKCFNGKPDDDDVKVGDHDRGTVWVALGDWDYHRYGGTEDCPVEVSTLDKSTFFNPKGENVIAYGNFVTNQDIDEWTKVEIPLEYTTTSRKPTHIIISAAASMLGDYFTGSPDSIMWLDDVRLEY